MKHTPALTSLATVAFALPALSQAPVGSLAEDLQFGAFDVGNQLVTHRLADFDGKIAVLYYFAPW